MHLQNTWNVTVAVPFTSPQRHALWVAFSYQVTWVQLCPYPSLHGHQSQDLHVIPVHTTLRDRPHSDHQWPLTKLHCASRLPPQGRHARKGQTNHWNIKRFRVRVQNNRNVPLCPWNRLKNAQRPHRYPFDICLAKTGNNFFAHGILFYHKNRLIKRFGTNLGEFLLNYQLKAIEA